MPKGTEQPTLRRLSRSQYESFWQNGYTVGRQVITGKALENLLHQLDEWVDESRSHKDSFGNTLDNLPRFSVEEGHSPARPRLRRVNSPTEVSQDYYKAMADSPLTDCVADLIGPSIKFHHSKINVKLPSTESYFGWHQDFLYTPHTNDDMVTALMLLDEIDERNGCLCVVPGSHKRGDFSLWQKDVFVGEVAAEVAADADSKAETVSGSPGDVCFMHTRPLHGSAPNASSDRRRALFINVYTAADAFPFTAITLPSQHYGEVVRGEPTRFARLEQGVIETPASMTGVTYFERQKEGKERLAQQSQQGNA